MFEKLGYEIRIEQDFIDIRNELKDAGFLRKQGKKEQKRPSKPREFRTSSGFRVLVGRNNRQNDHREHRSDQNQKLGFIAHRNILLCNGNRLSTTQHEGRGKHIFIY